MEADLYAPAVPTDAVWWGQPGDAERPGFYKGQRRLPSVGRILKAAGFATYFDGPKADEGKARGARVHTAAERYLNGEFEWHQLPEDEHGFIIALDKFVTNEKYVAVATEEAVHDPAGRYWGRLDTRGFLYGSRFLIDIKTGENWYDHDPLQLAAYARTQAEKHERMILLLKRNGDYKPVLCAEPWDEEVFMGALIGYEWKEAKGKLPNTTAVEEDSAWI